MKPIVALTPVQLRALLSKTRDHSEMFYVLFLLSVAHGLRVSEVIKLKRRDFKTTGDAVYLTVQRLKGSKKTTQKLLSSTDPLFDEVTVVMNWIAQLKTEYLFMDGKDTLDRWQVDYKMKQFGLWAGVPSTKCHSHVLKHTCGVLMRCRGAKLEEIKEALGHVSINSTAQYLRVTSDEVDDARANAFDFSEASAETASAAAAGGV